MQDWTDWMWSRVADEDAPRQVRGTGKRNHQYIIEFHKGGATQVNLITNTRRTVRRIEGMMGFSTGSVRKDPCNVHNMPYGQEEYRALLGFEDHPTDSPMEPRARLQSGSMSTT